MKIDKEQSQHIIQQVLPHEYPFLLVDRVLECSEESAIGLKNISMNEQIFQGHFPKMPVYPGVLIIESLAQLATFVVWKSVQAEGQATLQRGVLAKVEKVNFRGLVTPGDQLELEVKLTKKKAAFYYYQGEARVEGKRVASVENLVLAIQKDEK